jgi:hypothetical protein
VTPIGFHDTCPGSFTKTETKKHYGYGYTYKGTLKRQTWLGRCVHDCTGTYELQPQRAVVRAAATGACLHC